MRVHLSAMHIMHGLTAHQAPDMRGYGGTDAPARMEEYNVASLAGDAIGLVHHLGLWQMIFNPSSPVRPRAPWPRLSLSSFLPCPVNLVS